MRGGTDARGAEGVRRGWKVGGHGRDIRCRRVGSRDVGSAATT